MSLDVSLITDTPNIKKSTGIFIRDAGKTQEISVEEWNERFPDRRVTVNLEESYESYEAYSANITHNLNKMAAACGIYDVVWHPETSGISHANQLIEPLREAIAKLKSNPEHYKQFNPSNGWGTYEGLIEFLEEYEQACIEYPDALVEVYR